MDFSLWCRCIKPATNLYTCQWAMTMTQATAIGSKKNLRKFFLLLNACKALFRKSPKKNWQ